MTRAAGAAADLQGLVPAQIERQIEQMQGPEARTVSPELSGEARTRVDLSEQSFTLAGVLVEGATVYSNLEFLSLYRPQLGRRTTVEDLRNVAEAFTRLYQKDGYFLSHAFVPAQQIEFGIVRIRVIEGYVKGWRFAADDKRNDPVIDRMLQPVLRQRPARRSDLVIVLQRINELPDLTVEPELRAVPGQPGVHELRLVTERKRFTATLSVDNRGSEFIGPVRESASLGISNLLDRHETYQLKLTTTAEREELNYIDASTEWRPATTDMRLRLSATHIRARPGDDLAPLDVLVVNTRYRLGLSFPLHRKVSGGHYIGGYIDTYRSRTDVLGARRLEDDLVRLQMYYRTIWAAGNDLSQSLRAAVTRGLPIGNAGVVDTQTGDGVGAPGFTSFRLRYSGRRILAKDWEILALVDGQYAVHELPSSERYSIGGGQFGSAYDPSEITGDHGLAGRLELARRHLRAAHRWRFRLYGAYDVGAVWNIADSAQRIRASAASLAGGIRAVAATFSASLELAKPLTRAVVSQGAEGNDVRAFARIGYRF